MQQGLIYLCSFCIFCMIYHCCTCDQVDFSCAYDRVPVSYPSTSTQTPRSMQAHDLMRYTAIVSSVTGNCGQLNYNVCSPPSPSILVSSSLLDSTSIKASALFRPRNHILILFMLFDALQFNGAQSMVFHLGDVEGGCVEQGDEVEFELYENRRMNTWSAVKLVVLRKASANKKRAEISAGLVTPTRPSRHAVQEQSIDDTPTRAKYLSSLA